MTGAALALAGVSQRCETTSADAGAAAAATAALAARPAVCPAACEWTVTVATDDWTFSLRADE